MKKNRTIIQELLVISCWVIAIGSLTCSCSADDNPVIKEDSYGRRMRQLTLDNASLTRATIDPSTFSAAWQTTDRPNYINLSALPTNVYYGALTPSTAGESTTLTGNVTCKNGDNIAVFFPNATPVQPSGEDAYFTIELSGQKGTLADIGTRYHYVYGVASGVSVNENTATGTIPEMKSLLSLCKFTFTKDSEAINVKSVQIGWWGITGDVGYPNTGTVTLSQNLEKVHAESGTPSGSLSVTLEATSTNVYVALFPCSEISFHFTVSDGTNTYTGTKKATMLEGRYYEVIITVQ